MPNIRREISKHNNKILYGENRAATQNEVYDCNCMPLKTRETCKVMPGIGCQVSNALWEDLGKQADIILHNHLQPPP